MEKKVILKIMGRRIVFSRLLSHRKQRRESLCFLWDFPYFALWKQSGSPDGRKDETISRKQSKAKQRTLLGFSHRKQRKEVERKAENRFALFCFFCDSRFFSRRENPFVSKERSRENPKGLMRISIFFMQK
jgi:hypothetical protein